MKNSLTNIIIILLSVIILTLLAYYFLFINKPSIEIIEFNQKMINIFVGESKQLDVTVKPNNTDTDIIWEIDNDTIASITSNGIVKGETVGSVVITAKNKNGSISDNCTVNVIKKEVSAISFEQEEIEILVGEKSKLEVNVLPKELKEYKINWESSDSTIVEVDDNGNITGIKNGEVKITASSGDVKASCLVKVVTIVESITLSKNRTTIDVEEIEELKVTVKPDNASNKKILWESSNNDVVTVTEGKILGVKTGNATITAKTSDGNVKATCEVTVIIKPKYTVKYVDMDQTVIKKQGDEFGEMPTPTKNGCKFLGWYTESTGGEKIETTTTVSNDMNLYAHWEGYYKHVFIIGVDGLGAAFNKVDSPNFDRIFSNYAYRHDAKTEGATISAQNWGSILTGVSYKTHGLTNENIDAKEKTSKSSNLSVFYYVRKSISTATLASIVNWNPINIGIVENDIGVNKQHGVSDDEVTDKIVKYLKNNGAPTLMYVHFDEVDHAAHTYGGFSDEYYSNVKKADKRIGKIYDAINSIGKLDDSLFIVVADHGETSNGHGGHSKEESSAELAVMGYTVNKLILDENTQNRDVAAITLYALGIDIPSNFVSKVPSNLFSK